MYKRTILVTGGCGAIGSEVINRLKVLHPDTFYINLDALTYAGNSSNIEEPYDNYAFIKGKITDVNLVSHILRTERPQCIFHLAAETHVDNSFGNSFVFTQTNVYGTHVLLECVRRHMAETPDHRFELFLHMSTDEVYGFVPDDAPAKTEGALFAPSNPYAATKAAAEMICTSYASSFKVPIVIMRCNNAISKYQHEEKLIPRAISSILQRERIPIHGEGKSKRTFIHAYDIADAIDCILDNTLCANPSIVNIGTRMEYTVMEVVEMIVKIMEGPDANVEDYVEYVPDRAFQDYRYHIDSGKIRAMGWKEKITVEDAIKDVIGWRFAALWS